jgi:hypothetical protein
MYDKLTLCGRLVIHGREEDFQLKPHTFELYLYETNLCCIIYSLACEGVMNEEGAYISNADNMYN